ncbi:DUF4382 domain-containing protein [Vibrio parahaemolyticus]|uniref:DUF4382 domain-containing protein n=1 Tax=Vibrio parahaemolyticus TaxID=670 RepID=UPI0022B5CDBC|nr:DUF4382 domain-containing protein [Vibrio parahaemolyticus]MCZ6415566.1 DUF4382 domain-containing protein [Vibrio parahaemolyticus]MCZ6421025.1 DUF4382 domain-containing protein [Vibrio parahaemolyticus]
MKKYTYPLLAISGGLLLTGCGGDDSSSNTESATFSLGVSDAPVDDANKVVLAFKDVVLIPFDPETGEQTGDHILLDASENGALHQVDLMEYQGKNAKTIISEQQIAPGDYAMCVYAKDGRQLNDTSLSYVEKTDGSVKGLVVPSRGSCFGFKPDTSDQGRLKFSQKGQYVKVHTGHNSYVVEFDLRKGLADPVGQDHMNMNSNAVSLVNASDSGHIAGTVSNVQYQACEADSAAWGATAPLNAPVAVANVNESQDEEGNTTYSYEFGYIGPGTYSIGYTCTAYIDTPDAHETSEDGFLIYQHYTPVDVVETELTAQDINPIL